MSRKLHRSGFVTTTLCQTTCKHMLYQSWQHLCNMRQCVSRPAWWDRGGCTAEARPKARSLRSADCGACCGRVGSYQPYRRQSFPRFVVVRPNRSVRRGVLFLVPEGRTTSDVYSAIVHDTSEGIRYSRHARVSFDARTVDRLSAVPATQVALVRLGRRPLGSDKLDVVDA
jgi:hypothetical protein